MLTTPDLAKTRAFYEDVLGFRCIATWPEDNPTWCHLEAGGAHVMFSYDEPHDHGDGVMHGHDPELTGVLYLYPTEDIATFYERVKDRANVVQRLITQDYGMRDFAITDPNGYTLSFGGPVA
jgi:catechol 2,3-dioxygenase-like lactoylglutathione lyase family enzyme